MAEIENHSSPPSDPAPSDPSTPHPQTGFNPSRMIGIIRRKAMIKDLAAIYHAECLAYCQELLELQKKAEESLIEMKSAEDSRRETMRPPKRMKKAR
uniref:Putative mediator of RNA polymerase II transcription subunit 15-like n=1 Tax=Solanum chacoense TaxID=4108 RepID=A0A0V0H281_SOLCH